MMQPWRWMQHIPPKCLFPSPRLHGANLKIEAVCSSKTCVFIYKTTWCHSTKDHNMKDRWIRITSKFGVWPRVTRNKFSFVSVRRSEQIRKRENIVLLILPGCVITFPRDLKSSPGCAKIFFYMSRVLDYTILHSVHWA
jgi:hypothetical protein